MTDIPDDPLPTKTPRGLWERLSAANLRGESIQTQTAVLARMASSEGWPVPMIFADVGVR